MTIWRDPVAAQPVGPEAVRPVETEQGLPEPGAPPMTDSGVGTQVALVKAPVPRYNEFGWAIPSSLTADPEEARASMALPVFDELLLEKARVISGRFPYAEAEYRNLRETE